MRIYRVEQEDGKGPYNLSGGLPYWVACSHSKENGRPNAMEDSAALRSAWEKSLVDRRLSKNTFFGFHCIGLMRVWFDDSAQYLTKTCHVSLYEVPEQYVACGKYQAIFDKRYAVLIETYPIEKFWKIEKEEEA